MKNMKRRKARLMKPPQLEQLADTHKHTTGESTFLELRSLIFIGVDKIIKKNFVFAARLGSRVFTTN